MELLTNPGEIGLRLMAAAKEVIVDSRLSWIDDKLRYIKVLAAGSPTMQSVADGGDLLSYDPIEAHISLIYQHEINHGKAFRGFSLEADRDEDRNLINVRAAIVDIDRSGKPILVQEHIIGGHSQENNLSFGVLMRELSAAHMCARANYSRRTLRRKP